MADRELLRRIISAAVMIPPVLAAVHFGPPWYTALIVILAAAMVWEWAHLAGRDPAWLVPGTVYMLGDGRRDVSREDRLELRIGRDHRHHRACADDVGKPI